MPILADLQAAVPCCRHGHTMEYELAYDRWRCNACAVLYAGDFVGGRYETPRMYFVGDE